MNLQQDLGQQFRRKVDLSKYCTMQVGGQADYFAEPKTRDDLVEAIQFAKNKDLPYFLLGKGSNVIFSDEGYKGVVISMRSFEGDKIEINQRRLTVTCSSSVFLYRLALVCRDAGLGGCEFLASIPGTVGGAVMMNAGYSRYPGQKNEIGDLIEEISALNPQGQKETLYREHLNFSYRSSGLEGYIILDARLRLWRRKSDEIEKEIRANFQYRNRKQDLTHPSSGSVFKNPEGNLAAGQIIDSLGLKGTRVGGIEVSPRHGNYFINTGQGTASDFKALVDLVQKTVFNAKNILLEPEVRFITNV